MFSHVKVLDLRFKSVQLKAKPILVQIMVWRRAGDKLLSEAMMVWFTDAYMSYLATMSYYEITSEICCEEILS